MWHGRGSLIPYQAPHFVRDLQPLRGPDQTSRALFSLLKLMLISQGYLTTSKFSLKKKTICHSMCTSMAWQLKCLVGRQRQGKDDECCCSHLSETAAQNLDETVGVGVVVDGRLDTKKRKGLVFGQQLLSHMCLFFAVPPPPPGFPRPSRGASG